LKILIVKGAFGAQYEPAWAEALTQLGQECRILDSHGYSLPGIFGRIERRLIWGPGIRRIREILIKTVKTWRPDITLIYQGHYFDRATLLAIKPYTLITGYHNDDPFGGHQGMLRYRRCFLDSLPAYDGFHVYRNVNIEDFKQAGVPQVAELRSYFIPAMDYPRTLSSAEQSYYDCDLVYIGHVEEDSRAACLRRVLADSIAVHLYGESRFWAPLLKEYANRLRPPVFGDEYRKALCGGKIAACFFSKWNRDLYTRRVFEIPACGVFLLAERTPVMQEIYQEGQEAEFFGSPEEFSAKIHYYLAHDEQRRRIAAAGMQRARTSGYDIHSRMKQWLAQVSEWKKRKVHSY